MDVGTAGRCGHRPLRGFVGTSGLVPHVILQWAIMLLTLGSFLKELSAKLTEDCPFVSFVED